ncbi:MAG: hypothetical protein HQK72_03415 [Desulfamplus sp.]|nr:hypothetical protein [Desulfamplus sp.]
MIQIQNNIDSYHPYLTVISSYPVMKSFIQIPKNVKTEFELEHKKKKNEYSVYQFQNIKENLFGQVDLNTFKNNLEKAVSYNDLVEFGRNRFPIYLFDRLTELKQLEEDGEISLDSLKSMLLFLLSIKNLKKPVITLNDMGIFQASWKKDRNNLLTTSFIKNWSLNYVLFRPSRYASERIILNGVMNVLDFKDYLIGIGIKIHREK